MAIYDTRRSTAAPIRMFLTVRLVDLVLRMAEWQARRRTRQLLGGTGDHLSEGAGLRRDDLGRF